MHPGASFQIFTVWSLTGEFWAGQLSVKRLWDPFWCNHYNQFQLSFGNVFRSWCVGFAAAVWAKGPNWCLLSSLFSLSLYYSLNPRCSAYPGLGKQFVDPLLQLLLPRSKQCFTCRNTVRQHLHPSCSCLPSHYAPLFPSGPCSTPLSIWVLRHSWG